LLFGRSAILPKNEDADIVIRRIRIADGHKNKIIT